MRKDREQGGEDIRDVTKLIDFQTIQKTTATAHPPIAHLCQYLHGHHLDAVLVGYRARLSQGLYSLL